MLVSRDEARLHETADALIAASGIAAEVLAADLSDLDDTRRVEERIRLGPVDMLVNSAGFGLNRTFPASDVEEEQRSMDVLVRAVMRLTHAALGPMLDTGRGDIVNVSSVAGFTLRGTYAAHKAWVTNFSSWAGTRYRSRGVRVMALCPGFVHTEFHQRMNADVSRIEDWLWLDAEPVVRAALEGPSGRQGRQRPKRPVQGLVDPVAHRAAPPRREDSPARPLNARRAGVSCPRR